MVRCWRMVVLMIASLTTPLSTAAAQSRAVADGDGRSVGTVIFQSSDVVAGNAGPGDRSALINLVVRSWERYLHQDVAGYAALLAPDVVRLSPRAGHAQHGRQMIAAELPKEWEAFERPGGVIAERMMVRKAELVVSADGAAATALYWLDIVGGKRWDYTDQGLIFQAFSRGADGWTIVHQSESWALDVDSDQSTKKRTFEFDYVYPVINLKRAVAFYTPMLGAPVSLGSDRAVFKLGGARFILDATALDGLAPVEADLPNGYAVFLVDDVVAARNRLRNAGVRFIGGTATAVKSRNGDSHVVGVDPAGNLFVLEQQNFIATQQAAAPTVSGFSGDDPYVQTARAIAERWMATDAAGVATHYATNGRWFDNSRLTDRGWEVGRDAIASALSTVYWPRYDRGAKGLVAAMTVSQVHRRAVGERTIVSYVMSLTGAGAHPFHDTAFVTHVFNGPSDVVYSMTAITHWPTGMAIEMDYTGYPVEDLRAAEKFYTSVMRLGDPYKDEDWRGYWSLNTVFGIYTADPLDDGVPRPDRGNGYISFWIRSAQDAYSHLKRQGARFPVFSAINSVSGIDPQPGYVQVVATDSEGNVVLFTEYTGRPR